MAEVLYVQVDNLIAEASLEITITANVLVSGTLESESSLSANIYTAQMAPILFKMTSSLGANVNLTATRNNWVKWSKIGYLDFTQDRTNEAGARPLDWKGNVWCLKKHTGKVIAYGENGVSALIPQGISYGLTPIHKIGLMGKGAVAGTDSVHWFVNNKGELWELLDGLKRLDYSEFLSQLDENTVLSYDTLNQILYICDGSYGFVYADGCLSEGPVSVSGIGYQGLTQYVASPEVIVTRNPEFVTDIFDLGSRSIKTIHSLELGMINEWGAQASVYYRNDQGDFFQTPWVDVDKNGVAWVKATGREFKFAIRFEIWEDVQIDYIKVNRDIYDN